jgi:hypothetical protein
MKKCPQGWEDCGRCHRPKFKSNAHGPDQAIRPLLPGAHGEAIEVREEWHRKREEILENFDRRPDLVRALGAGSREAVLADTLRELRNVEADLRRWVEQVPVGWRLEMEMRLGTVELANRAVEREGLE